VLVVLDEAYNEYLDGDLRSDAVAWVRQYPNVILSRTLSKAYGLAGLRVGYAVAQPAVTDILNRIRQPFNVNSLAQAAAVAAINDDAFLEHSKQLNNAGYAQLTAAFKRLGLSFVPSKANFVLVHIGSAGGGTAAVNAALLKQGVIVRPVAGYGLPDYLRVSIGLEAENAAFVAALERALAS
jgi:histidinol-phosphate aminotransferase